MAKTFFSVLAALIVGYFFITWVTGPSEFEKSIVRLQSSVKALNEAKCQAAGFRKNCLE